MNIFACLARVPDTATRIRIADDAKSIARDGVQFVINPYDEIALEEAVRFKETYGGELTVLHVGAEDFQKDLRQCLAKGADKAVHLKASGPLGPAGIAELLAAEIQPLLPAVVFCGKQSVDGDVGGTGIMLAWRLGLPVVSKISTFDSDGQRATCTREIEGGVETIETTLPAVFTCEKGLNEPRRAGLKEIMAAKKKPLESKDVEAAAPKLELQKLELPPERPEGRMVGQGVEAVPELVDVLKNEAKVIQP
jgi:electron transfer flavoprotein beta subunit